MLNKKAENNNNIVGFMKEVINKDNKDCKVDEKDLIFTYAKNQIRADRFVIDAINEMVNK